MRTKNGIKNVFYSSCYYVLVSLLGLITRKLTLNCFGSVLLGYLGVIENIFSWLNMAELGVGTVIVYSLYKALADDDIEQTRLIMSAYRMLYQIIGTCILAGCLALAFMLPFFFPNDAENIKDAYLLFYIEAANTLSTYFLAYCRMIFTADQKGYVCLRLDMLSQVFSYCVRIFIAWRFPFYPLYFAFPVTVNILVNFMILIKYRREYPQVAKPVKVSLRDLKSFNFFRDLKYFIVTKFAGIVHSSTDNIILSRVFGTAIVTATGNYLMISTHAYQLTGRFSAGITAGIGNLIYSQETSQERKWQIFRSLELMEYYIAAISYAALAILFQPFIRLWLGSGHLLEDAYVWVLAISVYLNLARKMLNEYRTTLGKFEMDMWYSLAGALVNLALSIWSAYSWGIVGIAAATAVGHLIVWAGYLKVVERQLFPKMAKDYIKKHLIYFVAATAVAVALWKLTIGWPVTVLGLLARAGCAVVVPAAVVTILFLPGDDAVYLREKVGLTGRQLLSKFKTHG